ncbi:MAG: M24 family metallopeptidase [Candidatus Levybacteria bacterium]|nr:M24 family metallopeptidase [Candidatus Levybacteria bacterium]
MGQREACKTTRKIATDSLVISLKELVNTDKPISEVVLRDRWLLEMRKHDSIFPDGWYTPPPHGIGVLFSTENDPTRTNYTTLRKVGYWPRDDVFLDRQKGIIMVYASPVDKATGTIGDFGLDLYLGKNEKLIEHFQNVYKTVHSIFAQISTGMTFAMLFELAYAVFAQHGLTNEGWISTTDPTGINVGHSIPFLDSAEVSKITNEKNWEKAATMISKKRKFINSVEQTRIAPGMVFTIEPRVKSTTDPSLPTIYFHTIALIHENGGKELLTNFDKIFKLSGMDYLIDNRVLALL